MSVVLYGNLDQMTNFKSSTKPKYLFNKLSKYIKAYNLTKNNI